MSEILTRNNDRGYRVGVCSTDHVAIHISSADAMKKGLFKSENKVRGRHRALRIRRVAVLAAGVPGVRPLHR